jgi:hypothetical protein
LLFFVLHLLLGQKLRKKIHKQLCLNKTHAVSLPDFLFFAFITICILTTAKNTEQALALLKAFGMPFQN